MVLISCRTFWIVRCRSCVHVPLSGEGDFMLQLFGYAGHSSVNYIWIFHFLQPHLSRKPLEKINTGSPTMLNIVLCKLSPQPSTPSEVK
ncbi:hypothetical protein BDV38DRAFT_202360 [Aspergillus pseudotamarii]|uniref:Uncharacterized protein n=1 Tax=Aspergillus pseudotamarii TaxID=132259 RepID=A0A5N6SFR3_ASPPS|nr:uncharacterized protein BDV38DRAFT_202360 [Aspergillus pseudotamarii]KAE8132709.1 hypothetical protein BDV38DRAFT_202360 [Aspergillus pseudotamarii]